MGSGDLPCLKAHQHPFEKAQEPPEPSATEWSLTLPFCYCCSPTRPKQPVIFPNYTMTVYVKICITSWRRGWQPPASLRAFKASPPCQSPLTLVVLGCNRATVRPAWQDRVAGIIHLRVPSTALLSSPLCKPLPNFSSHSASQCTWGTACHSGTTENFGIRPTRVQSFGHLC